MKTKLRKALILAFTTVFGITTYAQTFKMKFNVQPDANSVNSVTIPINNGNQYTYNYDVDWGDGNSSTGETGAATHDYGSSGVRTITITLNATNGSFPAISFLGSKDNLELTEIVDWGGSSFGWQSFATAFATCANLTTIPSGSPDLSSVTDISYAFMGASSLNDANINAWDVTNVTNMRGVFSGATTFNQSIDNWDTDGVTDMSSMFAHAIAFNQDFRLGGVNWNTGDVEDMSHMFEGAYSFNQYLGYWDISSVDDMSHMLSGSGLSGCNYQNTLNGWVNGTINNSVPLGANGLLYYDDTDRLTLTSTNSWIITGDYETNTDVCDNPDAFITMWDVQTTTTDDGTLEITIPTQALTGLTYDYVVDWGDGTTNSTITGTSGAAADATHTYSSAGNYKVQITGDFYSIYFYNSGDKDAITDVLQWGNMDWRSFRHSFYGCSNLTLFTHISPPDLSNINSLEAMFKDAISFNGYLGDWDISNVTNLSQMFSGASSFTSGGISSWANDVGNVLNMSQMFQGASSFNHNINGWDVSSNTTLMRTFNSASSFDHPLSNWNVSSVTTLFEMFSGANTFNQNISAWNVSSVTEMEGMFEQNTSFNNDGQALIWERDNTHPDGASTVSNVLDMQQMFRLATSFNADISSWDVSSVQNMTQMFQASPFNQDISSWDVGEVTTMSQMFDSNSDFNKDIGSWNVSKVTNMYHMFWEADVFNHDISGWNVSSVTTTEGMFGGADLFNQPLNGWERSGTPGSTTANIENMRYMFNVADAFNQDLDDWDVSSVTDMEAMFAGAENFDGNITTWDVSSVTDMRAMFKLADDFTGTGGGTDISNWQRVSSTLGNVENMAEMFAFTNNFNVDIDNWDVSEAETMQAMFYDANAFDQDLGSWNLSSIGNNPTTDMKNMFSSSGMSTGSYDNTLIGWYGTGTPAPSNANTPDNITFDALGVTYCAADNDAPGTTTSLYVLFETVTTTTGGKGWTITDAGKSCPALVRYNDNPNHKLEAENSGSTVNNSGINVNEQETIDVLKPQRGFIQVHVEDELENSVFAINIYTGNGQLVYSNTTCNENELINTQNFANGMYLVKISTDSKVESKKISITN